MYHLKEILCGAVASMGHEEPNVRIAIMIIIITTTTKTIKQPLNYK